MKNIKVKELVMVDDRTAFVSIYAPFGHVKVFLIYGKIYVDYETSIKLIGHAKLKKVAVEHILWLDVKMVKNTVINKRFIELSDLASYGYKKSDAAKKHLKTVKMLKRIIIAEASSRFSLDDPKFLAYIVDAYSRISDIQDNTLISAIIESTIHTFAKNTIFHIGNFQYDIILRALSEKFEINATVYVDTTCPNEITVNFTDANSGTLATNPYSEDATLDNSLENVKFHELSLDDSTFGAIYVTSNKLNMFIINGFASVSMDAAIELLGGDAVLDKIHMSYTHRVTVPRLFNGIHVELVSLKYILPIMQVKNHMDDNVYKTEIELISKLLTKIRNVHTIDFNSKEFTKYVHRRISRDNDNEPGHADVINVLKLYDDESIIKIGIAYNSIWNNYRFMFSKKNVVLGHGCEFAPVERFDVTLSTLGAFNEKDDDVVLGIPVEEFDSYLNKTIEFDLDDITGNMNNIKLMADLVKFDKMVNQQYFPATINVTAEDTRVIKIDISLVAEMFEITNVLINIYVPKRNKYLTSDLDLFVTRIQQYIAALSEGVVPRPRIFDLM